MDILNFIDTRFGTNNRHAFSHGNALPYTGEPFAMNYFVVQSDGASGSFFFNPNHRSFQGYRLTHQPSPWMGDFSHLLIMPITQAENVTDYHMFASSYRIEEATYRPHYMEHFLMRYRLKTRLSAKTYSAMIETEQITNENIQYIFQAPGIDLIHVSDQALTFSVVNYSDVVDKNFKMYLCAQFDHDIHVSQQKETLLITSQSSHSTLRIASSFISPQQAQLNLEKEQESSFDDYKEKVAQKWKHYLSKIEVEDHDFEKVKLFYQNFYRVFLFPQKHYEVNEQGIKHYYDPYSQTVKEGVMYTNNGFWDTSITVYPLFSLIAKEEYEEMLEGFLNFYRNSGWLPKWLSPDERGLMPGTLIDAVIADAAVKNIGHKLMPDFLEAMIHSAENDAPEERFGRRAAQLYRQLGYVPNEFPESVNQSFDNANSDFSIAKVAESLGKEDLAKKYYEHAKNFHHLFHPEKQFMIGKDRHGIWTKNFDPINWGGDYTEGSAWQNSFSVFYDIEGLKSLYKKEGDFEKQLLDLVNQRPFFNVNTYGFEIHEMSEMAAIEFGQIAISNQPSFHIPYLFRFSDKPEHTEILIKLLLQKTFKRNFDAYPGDEDNGSMSAWFVFSSLGFYPFASGTGEYVLGIPYYDKVTMNLHNGQKLHIETQQNYDHFYYVKETSINGQPHQSHVIKHHDIMKGMHIEFVLSLLPIDKKDYQKPFSLSK